MKWEERSQSYRRGFVEAMDGGDRDVYLLQTGATDLEEYEQGYADGLKEAGNVGSDFIGDSAER